MPDESNDVGVFMIRAWRDNGGVLHARVTQNVESGEPALQQIVTTSESEVLTAVKEWLNRLSSL